MPNNTNRKALLVRLTHKVAVQEFDEATRAFETAASDKRQGVAGVSAATPTLADRDQDVACVSVASEQATDRELIEGTVAALQLEPEVMPAPAPGHHDSQTYPEFDVQVIPKPPPKFKPPPDFQMQYNQLMGPPAVDAIVLQLSVAREALQEVYEQDAVAVAATESTSQAMEEADDHAGADGEGEADYDCATEDEDDGHGADDPHCAWFKTPFQYGLRDALIKHLGLTQDQMKHFLSPLRAQFGTGSARAVEERVRSEHALMMRDDPSCKYELEAFQSDVVVLRKHHENLLRRREEALDEGNYCEGRATIRLPKEDVMRACKRLQKSFFGTHQQVKFRKLDRDIYKCDSTTCGTRLDSRFGAMVDQEYGGDRNLKAFIGTGEFADRKIFKSGLEKAAEARHPPKRCKRKPMKPERKKKANARYYENVHNRINGLVAMDEQSTADLQSRVSGWKRRPNHWSSRHLDQASQNLNREWR